VLIAILHSIRTKIDKNKLIGIEDKATTQKKITSALVAGQIIETCIQSRLSGCFSSIEHFSHVSYFQNKGMEALAKLFNRKLRNGLVVLSRAGDALVGSERSNFLTGSMVLDRFLLVRALRFKYSFFSEGKRLFEEDRSRIPNSARKSKMIKSPSLVMEVTQNFRYGFRELSQVVDKKIFEAFK
jgi:hypothetical protein